MFSLPAFYPILDTSVAARRGIRLADAAQQMLEAGVRILQVRHKGFFSREVLETTEKIAQMCRERGAVFVVNDRADVARLICLATPGSALHLGQDDLPPSVARKVTGVGMVIGFSTHNETQLRAAAEEPVDYVALGPIFGTTTKENPDPMVGLDELRRLRPLSRRPLVAIGGITRENAKAVLAAGADSVAVIGDLFPESGRLRDRVAEWLQLTASARIQR
jgi:thiamine-phosphate pyrophosphorylase